MTFDNNISIGDIISILALVCTFFTLLIMKKQREDANRPYLVIENKTLNFKNFFWIDLENWNLEKNSIPNHKYNIENNKKPFDFYVKNVGNGVARDTKVKIKLENIQIIKLYEEGFIEVDNFTEKINEFKSKNFLTEYELYFPHLSKDNSFSLAKNLHQIFNRLNNLLFVYIKNNNFDSESEKLIPIIKIELKYKNILNKKFKEVYILHLHIDSWQDYLISYSIYLKSGKRY